MHSKVAIASIIGGVAIYEALCPDGELISEQVDRIMSSKMGKIAVHTLVWTVAGHLTGVIPEKYDWLHRLASMKSSGPREVYPQDHES